MRTRNNKIALSTIVKLFERDDLAIKEENKKTICDIGFLIRIGYSIRINVILAFSGKLTPLTDKDEQLIFTVIQYFNDPNLSLRDKMVNLNYHIDWFEIESHETTDLEIEIIKNEISTLL
jgi:hypothetical protein